jgi:outer membrane protein assembly factor BamB
MAKRLRSLTLLALAALAACAVVAPAANGAVVKWRFEVAGQYILQSPAVAPDGTVAVVGSSGNLYSLTPSGALRWMVPGVGGHGGPSFGPDGTVYVGVDRRITAVAPNGTIRWSFVEPAGGQGVIAGPTVGPDGNVYVISDYGGLGAFALSPQGALLWSNAGNPVFTEYGQLGAEVVFGAGRLFAGFDEYGAAATSILYALTLGGTQIWAVPVPTSNDVFMQRQAQPAVGPDGSLYLTGFDSRQGWLLVRFDPATGSVVWTYSQEPANGMSPPSVGPDGSIYLSRSLGYLDAVNPSGARRWTFFGGSIIDLPQVSPDGRLVVAGDRPDFGQPGRLRGWNAVNGALAFQVELPTGDDGYQIVYTPPRFSADSRTAYVGTSTFYRPETSFLYAVDIAGGPPPPPPPPPPPGPRPCSVPPCAMGRASAVFGP